MHFNLAADTYDPSASVLLFQKQMAKRGNAESQFKLGLMYETGSGVKSSPVLAASWYKKAAKQKYKPASNRLTYLEIKKSGFNDSHNKWLKQLKSDARFNEGEALFLLGQMYSEGTAVEKNLKLSLKLLQKASGVNIPGSETEIARVERELALLEEQKKSAENNKKAIAAAAVAAKKIVKNPVKPIIPATPTATITRSNKNIKSKTQKVKTKPTAAKSIKKRPITINKTPPKAALIITPVITPPPAPKTTKAAKTHPMDTICGGRNRFSRNCR